jgi:hypothetical protein
VTSRPLVQFGVSANTQRTVRSAGDTASPKTWAKASNTETSCQALADWKIQQSIKSLISRGFKKLARSLLSPLHNKNNKSGKPDKNKT